MHPYDILLQQFLAMATKQWEEDNPPQVRQTVARLEREGFTQKQAMDMVAACVGEEMQAIIATDELFNEQRYVKTLANLPVLPTPFLE